ncbi:hypothetical protein MSG28_001095, partial [Choristoneura fumiferana]
MPHQHSQVQQNGIGVQILNDDLAQYAMEKEGYCGAMSRACRYKQVNFAIATAKGSPLRYCFYYYPTARRRVMF